MVAIVGGKPCINLSPPREIARRSVDINIPASGSLMLTRGDYSCGPTQWGRTSFSFGTDCKKHVITNKVRSAYLVPQENFYIRGSDTLEGEGTRIVINGKLKSGISEDRERQLRDFYKLRADKILTQEEYGTAKQ